MTEPDASTVLAPPAALLSRRTPQSVVVLGPGDEAPFVLRDEAAEVWGLIDGRRSLDSVVAALARRHGVEVEVVRADVVHFATDLLARGALERRSPDR